MFVILLFFNGGINCGLFISCFLNDVDDFIEGLVVNFGENVLFLINGGGIGINWSCVCLIGEVIVKGVDIFGVMVFMYV